MQSVHTRDWDLGSHLGTLPTLTLSGFYHFQAGQVINSYWNSNLYFIPELIECTSSQPQPPSKTVINKQKTSDMCYGS